MKDKKHVGIRRFAAVALSLILTVTMAPLGVWAEGETPDTEPLDFSQAVTANTLTLQSEPQELVTVDPAFKDSEDFVIQYSQLIFDGNSYDWTDWNTAIPTGSSIGSYTIRWRVVNKADNTSVMYPATEPYFEEIKARIYEHYHAEDGNYFTAWGNGTGEDRNLPNVFGTSQIYLTKDITLSDTYTPKYDIKICLNGHKITMNKSEGSTGNWTIIEGNANSGSIEIYDDTGLGSIDGEGKNNCITVANNTLVLDNVNIINGNGYARSGGVEVSENVNSDDIVSLKNVKIQNCTSQSHAGGISISATSAYKNEIKMEQVAVSGCSSTYEYTSGGGVYLGGGKYNISGLGIDHCSSGGYGGGLCLNGATGTIDTATIENNTATMNGGGVLISGFNGTFSDLRVTGNSAEKDGGGIYIAPGTSYFGTHPVALPSSTTLTGNTAGYNGGGLYVDSGQEVTVSCPVKDNTARLDGGGIYDAGTVHLATPVTGNKGSGGGGVYVKRNSLFELVGSNATVSGNTSSSNYNNIRLDYDAFVTLGTMYKKTDVLGVSSENIATASNPVTITKNFESELGQNAKAEDYFRPEGASALMDKKNGEVVFYRHAHSWSFEHTKDADENEDPSTAVLKCVGDGACAYSEGFTINIHPDANYEYYNTVNPRFAYVSIIDNATGESGTIPQDAWITVFQNDSIDYYKIENGTETKLENGTYPRDPGTYKAVSRVKVSGASEDLGAVECTYPILKPLAEGTVESRGTLPFGSGNQDLVTAKNVKNGDPMYYVSNKKLTAEEVSQLDKDSFTSTAKGSGSGTYYVYWYIEGDSNHSDTEIAGPVVAVISEKHNHDNTSFIQWDSADSLPNTEGDYYLTRDIVLDDRWDTPPGSLNDLSKIGLCLNGHTISWANDAQYKGFSVYYAVLDLYDCQESGKIDGGGTTTHFGVSTASGRFNMHGGTITGFPGSRGYSSYYGNVYVGGGVYLNGSGSSSDNTAFEMTGGTIESGLPEGSTQTTGAGVYMFRSGDFKMSGGTITGFNAADGGGAVKLENGYLFEMSGGTITGNRSNNGGGIRVLSGTFRMSGGTITGNEATSGNGGGVCITGGTAELNGGQITGNKASDQGGGVYNNYATLRLGDIEITNNDAGNKGGGVYQGANSTNTEVYMSGAAKIADNTKGNLYLDGAKKLNINGSLTKDGEKASVGVTLGNMSSDNLLITRGFKSSTNGAEPADYFISDNPDYTVDKTDDGEGILSRHVHNWTVTLNDLGNTATFKCTVPECKYETGKEYTVSLTGDNPQYRTQEQDNYGYGVELDNKYPDIITSREIKYYFNDPSDTYYYNSQVSSYYNNRPGGTGLYRAEVEVRPDGGEWTLLKFPYEILRQSYAEDVVTPKVLDYTGEEQALVDIDLDHGATEVYYRLQGTNTYKRYTGKVEKEQYGSGPYDYRMVDCTILPKGTEARDYVIEYYVYGGPYYVDLGSYDEPLSVTATIRTPLEVYYVEQATNGRWTEPTDETEPNEILPRTEGYQIPPSTQEGISVTSYSVGEFKASEADRTKTSSGNNIQLSKDTEKLYIYFTRDEYTLTFHNMDNSVYKRENVRYGASLAAFDKENLYKEGYTFAGWTNLDLPSEVSEGELSRNQTNIYHYKETLPDSGKDAEDLSKHPDKRYDLLKGTVTGNVDLYPMFVQDRLEVRLNLGAYDAEAVKEKYDWYQAENYDANSPAVMAAEQSREFRVNINEPIRMLYVDDEDKIDPNKGMLKATREGYDLAGWYTQDALLWNDDQKSDPKINWQEATTPDKWWPMTPDYCDKDENKNPIMEPTLNHYNQYIVTLTAGWTPKTVGINYVVGDGTATIPENPTVTYTKSTKLAGAATPTDSNYLFVGWSDGTKTYSGGADYVFDDWSKVGTDGKLTMTAVYQEKSHVTIQFDTDGGTAITQIGKNAGDTVDLSSYAKGGANAPTKVGHTFDGWDKELMTSIPSDATNGTVYTYKAQWTKNKYKLTFEGVGGTPVPEERDVEYGEIIQTPTEVPTQSHFVFKEWSETFPYTMPASDVTIYALWDTVTYSVTYKFNDGKTDDLVVTSTYGLPLTAPDIPEYSGHVFSGWTDKDGKSVELPAYMPDTNPTYTAKWLGTQETPDAPTLEATGNNESCTITVTNPVLGQVYSIDGGKTWKPYSGGPMTFTGLEPVKEYTVMTKKPATADLVESDTASSTKETPKLTQAPPAAPPAKAVSPTSIEVSPAYTGMKYRLGEDGEWVEPTEGKVVFEDLDPNQKYSVYAMMDGTDKQMPSDPSEPTEVTTPKYDQETPDAPQASATSTTTIEVDPVEEGLVYTIDGKNWIGPDKDGRVIFEGLNPNTTYRVSARIPEDETHNASPASEPTEVKTPAEPSGGGKDKDKDKDKKHTYKDCPKDETCPIYPFKDSNPKEWYHDGVHWAIDEGIMNGMSADTFEPNTATSRAMIVTMLWRMEGQPSAVASTFTDLEKDSWYEAAVNWAAANDIVNGYSAEKFGPNDTLTREQLATILYRYAGSKNNVDEKLLSTNLLDYDDVGDISDWAMDAMHWAVGYGIINGMTETTLAPQGSATRAQVATMLMRYNEN